MSTVFDVDTLQVESNAELQLGTALTDLVIQIPTPAVPNIDLSVPNTVSNIDISVPGVQGPPGLQNVYVSEDNPAIAFGWGPEEEGFIWAQIT